MVKRSKGTMVKTRNILKKRPRDRGMPPVTAFVKEFEIGEKANIVIEPSSQKGQPHRRYQGRVGTVVDKKGDSFVVRVEMERTHKDIIIRLEHLKKVK